MKRPTCAAIALGVGCVLAACSVSTPSATADFGPLAVVSEDTSGAMQALGGIGAIQISERCVVLLRDDDRSRITLIWRLAEVQWDEASAAIAFRRGAGPRIILTDGVRIEIGGTDEVRGPWVQRPDGACPGDTFTVHTVSLTP